MCNVALSWTLLFSPTVMGLVVAAKYGVEPDAGSGFQRNSAHDLGSWRYVSIGCNGRIIALESQNHWLSHTKC